MSPISPILVQRRMMELGRVRLGEKGPKGEPRKRQTFRFTSASKQLLDAVAALYGGTVREWVGAPVEGYYEVATDATELNIILPPVFSATDGTPTAPYSQWFELWSGGGCQRRCDGVTEALSGKACLCDPENRACQVTTRMSFMLPDIPGLGVWRVDSQGWNAAKELPGAIEVLLMAAAERQFIPAILRIEERIKKVPGKGTRRFVVPVLDLPQLRVGELLAGQQTAAVNPPALGRPAKPELVAGTAPDPSPEPMTAEKPQPAEPDWGEEPEPENPADSPDPLVEAEVKVVLELAAQVDEGTYAKVVDALAEQRKNGRLDMAYLARARKRLEKLLPEGEQAALEVG